MGKPKKESKNRYSAAYRKAVEEIAREQVLELKAMVKGTMDAIRTKEAERRKLDGELDFLKRDIEDLKRGRIEKIRKRHEEDAALAAKSKIVPDRILQLVSPNYQTSGVGLTSSNTSLTDANWINPGTWTTLVDSVSSTQ
jgi:chromosome segregation ATPase